MDAPSTEGHLPCQLVPGDAAAAVEACSGHTAHPQAQRLPVGAAVGGCLDALAEGRGEAGQVSGGQIAPRLFALKQPGEWLAVAGANPT
jgi:hypothetical protein